MLNTVLYMFIVDLKNFGLGLGLVNYGLDLDTCGFALGVSGLDSITDIICTLTHFLAYLHKYWYHIDIAIFYKYRINIVSNLKTWYWLVSNTSSSSPLRVLILWHVCLNITMQRLNDEYFYWTWWTVRLSVFSSNVISDNWN